MTVTFRLKPKEMQAVQWSGSNWHEMLEVFGKDVVSTDGKDLFVRLDDEPDRPIRLHVGQWLSTGLSIYDQQGLASHWDRVEEGEVNPATT